MKDTAHVFPGQGSQRVGMGHDLYSSNSRAKNIFDEADAVLGFSLSKLCFEGPEDVLRQTVNAQPAILVTSIAHLVGKGLWDEYDAFPPVFVAGHSLGEYTALVAANVLAFADAVYLARERGRLMQEAGERAPGGMVALIGADEGTVQSICEESGAQIANVNSSEQIVVSGPEASMAQVMMLAREKGVPRVVPLSVSAAFHSRLMEPVVESMREPISRVDFRDAAVPLIANTTAEPIARAEDIENELLDQICNCVQWCRSVEYMVNAGVSTIVEVGPGNVLTGLTKRIAKDLGTASTERMS
jgi:[acyl-carrier-protein] S-malonyltransferase